MKNFMNTRLMDMTIAQSFLYMLLLCVISLGATICALMIPQSAMEIFDWCETKMNQFKNWLRKEDRPE